MPPFSQQSGLLAPLRQQYFPFPPFVQQSGPEPPLTQQSLFSAPFLQQYDPELEEWNLFRLIFFFFLIRAYFFRFQLEITENGNLLENNLN